MRAGTVAAMSPVAQVLFALMPPLLAVGTLGAVVVCVGWPRVPYRRVYNAGLVGCAAGLFGLAIAVKMWHELPRAGAVFVAAAAALHLAALVRSHQVPGPLTQEERTRIAAMSPEQRKELLGEDG